MSICWAFRVWVRSKSVHFRASVGGVEVDVHMLLNYILKAQSRSFHHLLRENTACCVVVVFAPLATTSLIGVFDRVLSMCIPTRYSSFQ